MPKGIAGGSPSSSIFIDSISGPPPGTATVGSLLFIELSTIPVGSKLWLGLARYTSPDKSVTFELRSNYAGKSSGNNADTYLLDTCAASTKSGAVTRDLYKNGTLHTSTVVSTGVEKLWLALKSKSSIPGSYMFSLNYLVET